MNVPQWRRHQKKSNWLFVLDSGKKRSIELVGSEQNLSFIEPRLTIAKFALYFGIQWKGRITFNREVVLSNE